MKVRESGMPDEQMWRDFFDAESILRSLQLHPACGDVVEFGCGYGTFTLPAARIVAGTVYALDIEAEMVAMTRKKAADEGLQNVEVHERDFVAAGTGLAESSVVYAMLFNILHIERPEKLLTECFRVLKPGGRLAVSDIALKKQFPTELAGDLGAYVSCIAGAIPVEDYRRELIDAGFAAVEVVDSGNDLNSFAKLENQSSGCSTTATSMPIVTEESACCLPVPTDTDSLHQRLAELLRTYDVNDDAASFRIFAVKCQ